MINKPKYRIGDMILSNRYMFIIDFAHFLSDGWVYYPKIGRSAPVKEHEVLLKLN